MFNTPPNTILHVAEKFFLVLYTCVLDKGPKHGLGGSTGIALAMRCLPRSDLSSR